MGDDRNLGLAGLPGVHVGVDVTAVDEVADSVRRMGDRYVRRLFTDHEVTSSRGTGQVRAESLAARFAAKEATVKVLRPDGSRPPWKDIEVWRRQDGSCELRLHGSAAALAARRGIGHLSVSLSHEAGVAVAVVAATCGAGAPCGAAAVDEGGQRRT